MTQRFRLSAGGRIDRATPVRFAFNGRRYEGHPGDTLASALLANGVHLVARSFKYHRPRGILSAGSEEPNALVQVGLGARSEPNLRATQVELHEGLVASSQNCWPSVGWDLGAVTDLLSPLLPAGFYYKTFMWPASWWMRYEHGIRRMAGMGRVPVGPDPDRYEHMNAHCDVLVVGGGPAGVAAALAAGRAGARVILADEQAEFGGGALATSGPDGRTPFLGRMIPELASLPEVRALVRTTITGYYDHNFLVGIERVTDHLGAIPGGDRPRHRLWRIRAGQVVLATGAIERPLVFGRNDRPGIMLAGAVRTYLGRYGVRCGSRAVVVTNNDTGYRTALALAEAGVRIAALADLRAQPDGALPAQAHRAGIPIVTGTTIRTTDGRARVQSALLEPVGGGRGRDVSCDLVAMSGGWTPTVHLFSQSRGKLRWDDALGAFLPDASPQPVFNAGACNGEFDLSAAIRQGYSAGAAAAGAAGFDCAAEPDIPGATAPASEAAAAHAVPRRIHRSAKQFVDFQNDVTAADIRLAAQEGYASVEHLKRYTTTGMGTDQGKTGNLNALAILADLGETTVPGAGVTTYRPPFTPLSFGAVAGSHAGALFDPVRTTPMHDWHVAHGACFEDVGQWKRPWYFPRPGESMHDAVARECLAARRGVAMVDASTLGKIDVQGPDAAAFLDRVYCNRIANLGEGRCRYGLMLRQDGMVFDDGVVTRLGASHFLLSTTTGGAARVLAWLEEWLQTEWPELRVFCTSVTEQYAVASLSGPKARAVVEGLADGIDFDAFPFMSVRHGRVAGIPARVFRVSFTGATGYEIAVSSDGGRTLWDALVAAGAPHGLTPYGTEAMHVLRAEAGFIMVGQETDGTVTPDDLGLGRMAAKRESFIGQRSLARADTVRADRKQLVGLLTEDGADALPEGAQIVADLRAAPPMTMIGHVTSSYRSANAGRPIAFALVKGGRARMGATLHVPLADRTIRVRVTEPRFLIDEPGAAGG